MNEVSDQASTRLSHTNGQLLTFVDRMQKRRVIPGILAVLGITLLCGWLVFGAKQPKHEVECLRIISTQGPRVVAEFRISNFYQDGLRIPSVRDGTLSYYALEAYRTNQYVRMGDFPTDASVLNQKGEILAPGERRIFQATIDKVEQPFRIIVPFYTFYGTSAPSSLPALQRWARQYFHFGRTSRPVLITSDWISIDHGVPRTEK